MSDLKNENPKPSHSSTLKGRVANFGVRVRQICGPAASSLRRFVTPLKAGVPIAVGIFIFCELMLHATKKGRFDIAQSQLMHSTVFLGLSVVYCVFAASIIVAIIGTVFYFSDLEN